MRRVSTAMFSVFGTVQPVVNGADINGIIEEEGLEPLARKMGECDLAVMAEEEEVVFTRVPSLLEEEEEEEEEEEAINASLATDNSLATEAEVRRSYSELNMTRSESGKTTESTEPGSTDTFHSCVDKLSDTNHGNNSNDNHRNTNGNHGNHGSHGNHGNHGNHSNHGDHGNHSNHGNHGKSGSHENLGERSNEVSTPEKRSKSGLRSVIKIALFMKRRKRRDLRKGSFKSNDSGTSNSISNSVISEQAVLTPSLATDNSSLATTSMVTDNYSLATSLAPSNYSLATSMALDNSLATNGSVGYERAVREAERQPRAQSELKNSDLKRGKKHRAQHRQILKSSSPDYTGRQTAPPSFNRRFDVRSPTFSMLESRGRCYRAPVPSSSSVDSVFSEECKESESTTSTSSLPSLPSLECFRRDSCHSAMTTDNPYCNNSMGNDGNNMNRKAASENDLGLLYVTNNRRSEDDFRLNFVMSPRKLTPPPRRKNNIGRIFCFPNCIAPFDRNFMMT